jgi:hypothetical protein
MHRGGNFSVFSSPPHFIRHEKVFDLIFFGKLFLFLFIRNIVVLEATTNSARLVSCLGSR